MDLHYYRINYRLKTEPYYIQHEIYISSFANIILLKKDFLGENNKIEFRGDKGFSIIDTADIKELSCVELTKEDFKHVIEDEHRIEGVSYLTETSGEFMFRDLYRK